MLKEILKSGTAIFGTFVKVPAPQLIEVISHSGIGYVVVDQEHGALSFGETETLIRAANSMGLPAVVRIPEVTRSNVMHALDSGATGIMVPMVDTVQKAKEAIAESYYPPKGRRGLSKGHRSIAYGFRELKEYLNEADKSTLIIAQIENQEGVSIVDDLASIEGIDVLFVGPTDLSLSLDAEKNDNNTDETVESVMKKVCRAADKAGIQAGTLVNTEEKLENALNEGMRFILWGSDLGLLSKSTHDLKAILSKIN